MHWDRHCRELPARPAGLDRVMHVCNAPYTASSTQKIIVSILTNPAIRGLSGHFQGKLIHSISSQIVVSFSLCVVMSVGENLCGFSDHSCLKLWISYRVKALLHLVSLST